MKRGYIDVPEGQIHYQYEGSGPALLCVHQGPLSSNEYSRVMPILAKTHQVIAIDMLGYGKSDPPPHVYEVEDYARSLIDVLKALDIEKASIIGSKLGATFAVEAAITYPNMVDKLILHGLPGFDPVIRKKLLNSWRYSTQFTELFEDGSHLIRIWEREKRWGLSADPSLWQMAVADALAAGPECYIPYQSIFRYEEEEHLPLIPCPTLLISGPKDIFRPSVETFQELIPNCEVELIEDLEGLVMLMMPEKFAGIVKNFLTK